MVKIKENHYINLETIDIVDVCYRNDEDDVGNEIFILDYAYIISYQNNPEIEYNQIQFKSKEKRDEAFDRIIDYHDY